MSALMNTSHTHSSVFLLEQAENWFLALLHPVHTLTLTEDVARENPQATGTTLEEIHALMAHPEVQRRYMLSCRLQPELVEAIQRISVKVPAVRVAR